MTKRIRTLIIVLLSIGAVLFVGVAILAFIPSSASGIDLSARLSELVGVVEVRNSAQDKFNQVNEGFILKAIQQLQTEEESRARLDLSTGSIVRLGQRTIFSLDTPAADSGGVLSRIELQAGRVWVILKGGSLDVNTPGGLASVRGSYMSVWVETPSNRITVCCLEGYCRFENPGGSVEMTSGQKIVSSDPNIAPAIQGMDQTDFQTWINNSPESLPIVTQIYPLMVTSTPSLTPDIMPVTINTSTWTPTPTPTLTSTPCLETPTPTQTYTPSATMYAGSTPYITASPTVSSTPTNSPTATRSPCLGTASPNLNLQSTSTQTYTPSATMYGTFVPMNTPTPTRPAPGSTNPPPLTTATVRPPTQPPAPTATVRPPTQPPATQPPPTQPPPTQPPPTQPPYP